MSQCGRKKEYLYYILFLYMNSIELTKKFLSYIIIIILCQLYILLDFNLL